LRSYSKAPWQGQPDEQAEGINLRELGEQGDPIAQELWEKKSRTDFDYMSKQEDIEGVAESMYRVYLGMSYEYSDPVAAWKWLCKAADMGHGNAQIEVAYWHRESNWKNAKSLRREWMREAGIKADDRIAYLWYTLAAKDNDKRLRIRDYTFSEVLSENETAEAKDMVRNWKLGQCPTPYQ
jgi:TPR repeat protein